MEVTTVKKPLRYQGYSIVMQEVPDEISLAFNISGCTHKCYNCHSQNLWKYEGDYLGQGLFTALSEYKDYISCVCFMGGDQNLEELYQLCEAVKKMNLKVCIYSGNDYINTFKKFIENGVIDYLKIGRYIDDKGGLNSDATNQVMYKVINNFSLEDITYKFQTFTKM